MEVVYNYYTGHLRVRISALGFFVAALVGAAIYLWRDYEAEGKTQDLVTIIVGQHLICPPALEDLSTFGFLKLALGRLR
jgi:hypothetical protein